MAAYDKLIKGGTLVDGKGHAPYTADIAIKHGYIAAIGRDLGSARETVDADGLIVTPGWVDIHTHYDAQVTWDPELLQSTWHGVTSVVLGNCGVGFAPAKPERRQWLINLMEGVEDIPGVSLEAGMNWQWESFPEYIDALDAMPRAMHSRCCWPPERPNALSFNRSLASSQRAAERSARSQVSSRIDFFVMPSTRSG